MASIPPVSAGVSKTEITPEEFTSSPFAYFFRDGDYPRALEAIQALAKEYPDDPLVARYHALVLDRLGRTEEAIAIYRILLSRDPNHVPTHYFLGQAYLHQGDREASKKEWQWVIENSPAKEYRRWAQAQLDSLKLEKGKQVVRKRYTLFGSAGLEYDSNPLLKPREKALAAPGNEKQALRFSLNLGLGYRLVVQPDFRVDLIYTGRQSFHDKSAREVDFTSQELALDAKKRTTFMNRETILGSRYDLLVGFLRSDLFSVINRLTFSSDIRLTPRTRTVLYDRISALEFGPDGSNPPQTSRDGVSNDLGVTQYFYTADFRRYFFVEEELGSDWARGGNFRRRGVASWLGFHTPVPRVEKTDLDLAGGFDYGRYPNFTSLSSLDTRRRQDMNWNFYAAVTHYWTPSLATRGFYRFVDANNRNDFYDYERHVAGVQVLFTQ